MSEARSIMQSGSADRIDAVSARIRRRRWSLRQLLIALAAGLSLIFASLFGNSWRRGRRTRSVGKLAMTANYLTVRQLFERGSIMFARTPYRWIEEAEARRVHELAAVKRAPLDPHITIVSTELGTWQGRPFAVYRWRPKAVTGRQWHFGRHLALFHMRWPLL